MNGCYLCTEPRNKVPMSDWDLPSLNVMPTLFKLCAKHVTLVEEEIQKREAELPAKPKTYVLKKDFIPPVVKPERSFYEREPGSDDN